MPRPIITFTSDFGTQDWFVGVVHGVVAATAPDAHCIDLDHAIEPGAIAHAAFVLEAAAMDFPLGTVHLVVVDPGVGTSRRAIAVKARGQYFVGPDNGVLEYALSSPEAVVHSLTVERFFRRPISRTFHGRDVFAPVAAHLANGVALDQFGPRITDPVRATRPRPTFVQETLHGHVVFIDRFGNALTDLTAADIAHVFGDAPDEALEVTMLERRITGLARSYGDAPVGTFVAILGSSGRLEIAQVGGDLANRTGVGEGDPVAVRLAE